MAHTPVLSNLDRIHVQHNLHAWVISLLEKKTWRKVLSKDSKLLEAIWVKGHMQKCSHCEKNSGCTRAQLSTNNWPLHEKVLWFLFSPLHYVPLFFWKWVISVPFSIMKSSFTLFCLFQSQWQVGIKNARQLEQLGCWYQILHRMMLTYVYLV